MCSVQKVREVMKNRDRLCIMCILGGAISCSTVKAKFFFVMSMTSGCFTNQIRWERAGDGGR